MLLTLRRLMRALFFRMSLTTTLVIVMAYGASCYCLMRLAGEDALIASDSFIYWLMVTASTVGYGDLSPVTPLGKMLVGLWVIPLGLSVFALIVTKVSLLLSDLAFKGKRGLRMLQVQDHTVIIGWNGLRTLRLIELLLAKNDRVSKQLVLCVMQDMENPLPGKIQFVKVDSFVHDDTMKRANLVCAESIIIDTPQDDVTLTTALYCQKVSADTHTTAYFQDESIGQLLRIHCPLVECIPSVGVEMLAKSAVDPGSSLLHKQLLDGTDGMTQYSIAYTGQPVEFDVLFQSFKRRLSATIIGVKSKGQHRIDLNPSLNSVLEEGDTLFYIAGKRLSSQDCF